MYNIKDQAKMNPRVLKKQTILYSVKALRSQKLVSSFLYKRFENEVSLGRKSMVFLKNDITNKSEI